MGEEWWSPGLESLDLEICHRTSPQVICRGHSLVPDSVHDLMDGLTLQHCFTAMDPQGSVLSLSPLLCRLPGRSDGPQAPARQHSRTLGCHVPWGGWLAPKKVPWQSGKSTAESLKARVGAPEASLEKMGVL